MEDLKNTILEQFDARAGSAGARMLRLFRIADECVVTTPATYTHSTMYSTSSQMRVCVYAGRMWATWTRRPLRTSSACVVSTCSSHPSSLTCWRMKWPMTMVPLSPRHSPSSWRYAHCSQRIALSGHPHTRTLYTFPQRSFVREPDTIDESRRRMMETLDKRVLDELKARPHDAPRWPRKQSYEAAHAATARASLHTGRSATSTRSRGGAGAGGGAGGGTRRSPVRPR